MKLFLTFFKNSEEDPTGKPEAEYAKKYHSKIDVAQKSGQS